MEFIEIDQANYDSFATNQEILDNAIGDRRKKRVARRKAEALKRMKAATLRKPTKRRAVKRLRKAKKYVKKAPKRVKRIEKRQVRRKKIGKVIKRAPYAVLLPLRPVLRKAVERKGVSTKKMKIDELAKQFYNLVVVKESKGTYELVDYDPDTDNIDPITITAVVSAIVGFVKSLKRQKDEGKELTPAQESIADGVEKVQDKLIYEAKVEGAEGIGKTLFMDGKIWLILGAAVVVLILLKK